MNTNDFLNWLSEFPQRRSKLSPSKPLIMAIMNMTPDSFSDDGHYSQSIDVALTRAQQMLDAGADIIDVGGESSRPGARPVSEQEELDRVLPVIRHLRSLTDAVIAIDSCKATVMQHAVAHGANMINDINALLDNDALTTAAQLQVPVCLMHKAGSPDTMQHAPYYADGIGDTINTFFAQRINTCVEAGIKREHLILDPGFGFGKTLAHNMTLMRELRSFNIHNLPILLGVSRKHSIGLILNKAVSERLIGGLALAVYAYLQGVSIIRTHDVDETKQAFLMIDAIYAQ